MTSQQQKKPRLSLQIKTSVGSSPRPARKPLIDPRDPTAFNTISNAYVTAIERSTPVYGEPLTAINTLQAFSLHTPVEPLDMKLRVSTPYLAHYSETPLSAHPASPMSMEIRFPSTMTSTPPLSGTTDSNESKIFTFSAEDTTGQVTQSRGDLIEARSSKRRAIAHICVGQPAGQSLGPPYTPSQARHSILRNSPLPPRTAIPPTSPRRQSLRLRKKAARRVAYNSPIEQEITSNKYTRSHVDLVCEDASPNTPVSLPIGPEDVLDVALEFAPNEIQDGGQTPGPFEETRRMMSGSGPASLASPTGIQKRKRKGKKRRWVWTIGQDEDVDEKFGGAVVKIRAETQVKASGTNALTLMVPDRSMAPIPEITEEDLPTPSIESSDAWSEYRDVEMKDCSSIVSEDTSRSSSLFPGDLDVDAKTPTGPRRASEGPEKKRDTPIPEWIARKSHTPLPESNKRDTPIPEWANKRDTPIPELNAKRGTPIPSNTKRDTPIPPELLGSQRNTPVPREDL